MSFVLATLRKDFKRILQDPAALVSWLGIPLLIGTIMVLLSGGKEGPKPQAHVLVVDRDDSFLSGLLVGSLSQDRAGGFVQAESVEESEGRARIAKGEASALLVIPEGFADALLQDEPAEIELVKNPAQRILPGLVEEMVSVMVEGTFYAQRTFGDELRPIFDDLRAREDAGESTGPSDQLVSTVAIRVNGIVERLQNELFPPAIVLRTEAPPEIRAAIADSIAAAGGDVEEKEPAAKRTIALLFVPGLLFMSLLFMSQGIASDVWREREMKTLRRVVASPRPVAAFLLGKVLAGVAFVAAVAAVALAAGYAYFELPWATYPLAVAWCAISGALLIVLLAWIKMGAGSARASEILSMAVIFPLMMLGGSFFPFEAMPEGMRAIGKWTPNGWALLRLKEILLGEIAPATLAASLGGLLAVIAVLFLLSARRLGGRFARSG
ncbi:MAG: ABC transporter permease [bacterium]